MKTLMKRLVIAACLTVMPGVAFGGSKSLEGYNSPLIVLPLIEWDDFEGNSPEHQAYFHGALETYGYILYGYWPRTPKHEQEFSAYRKCVEENHSSNNWRLGWVWGKYLKSSVAAQLVRRNIPNVCHTYAGKGDGEWNPPRVVGKQEWKGYTANERKFYVSAYIETTLELAVLMQRDQDVSLMTQCMEDKGVNKVLDTLKEIQIEWQYPMPWSVARALGSVCKGPA